MVQRLPDYLYDLKGSLRNGTINAAGYLMRIRIEMLVALREGEVGLRRATHVAALSEVVYRSLEGQSDTGMFSKSLKEEVNHRLVTAHLQPQEQHFRDIGWWQTLDRVEARNELRSNLERLVADPLTTCLLIGIELHVLFDILMRCRHTDYESVIDDNMLARSGALRQTIERFGSLLKPKVAA